MKIKKSVLKALIKESVEEILEENIFNKIRQLYYGHKKKVDIPSLAGVISSAMKQQGKTTSNINEIKNFIDEFVNSISGKFKNNDDFQAFQLQLEKNKNHLANLIQGKLALGEKV